MNVLDMLQAYLQRARAGGGGSDPDWQAQLAELGDNLPPRDQVIASGRPSPGRLEWGQTHDPYVYGREPSHADALLPQGDVVLPRAPLPFADVTSRVPQSIHRNDANMYQFLPISMRGPPGAPPQRTAMDTEGESVTPQSLPPEQSPYATRLPSALNQLLRRGPFALY